MRDKPARLQRPDHVVDLGGDTERNFGAAINGAENLDRERLFAGIRSNNCAASCVAFNPSLSNRLRPAAVVDVR